MKLSLTHKFMTLLIPLAVIGVVSSWISLNLIGKLVHSVQSEGHQYKLATMSRLHISEMADALKSYMLDPSNEAEAKRKMDADEGNGAVLDELSKISTDQMALKIVNDMKEFDEKTLNPSEDKVIELVKAGKQKEARDLLFSEYLPLRKKYNEMSDSLMKRYAELEEIGVQTEKSKIWRPVWSLATGLLIFSFLLIFVVRSLTASLQSLVQRLNSGATEVTNASGRVSEMSTKLSASTTQQAAALQETAASIDEVSAMVAKNAENAKGSQNVAVSSTEKAARGRETVQRMISSINEISTSNAEMENHIKQSNAELANIVRVISEIGNKTNVINDIVFQTKLLSFNASVEAARAGEHGKGFAVVAEEVGNLAQMSGNAAKEISEMLEKSISEVSRVANTTKEKVEVIVAQGKAKLDLGTQNAHACGDVLNEIVSQVGELNRMVGEISTASQEQSVGVKEITKAINQLDQVTQTTANESQSSAQNSEQLLQQADQMREVVGTLVLLIDGGRKAA